VDDESHGIANEDAESVMQHLGIKKHTEEDCRISSVLYSTLGKPVVVDGTTVFVMESDAWMRYRISAGTRRRLLVGNTGRSSWRRGRASWTVLPGTLFVVVTARFS
jgi:hypothetical protein